MPNVRKCNAEKENSYSTLVLDGPDYTPSAKNVPDNEVLATKPSIYRGKRSSWRNDVLADLLLNHHCCRYQFAHITGHTINDYQTRICELRKAHWPILCAWHTAVDNTGAERRCMIYWLNRESMAAILHDHPDLTGTINALISDFIRKYKPDNSEHCGHRLTAIQKQQGAAVA